MMWKCVAFENAIRNDLRTGKEVLAAANASRLPAQTTPNPRSEPAPVTKGKIIDQQR